jgi:sec-independent protein translocase protein TatA
MPNIGPLEIVVVLVIVLVIFGPKRLPDLGRSLGRGMREFKDSVTGKDSDEPKPELHSSSQEADVRPAAGAETAGETRPPAKPAGTAGDGKS